MTTTTPVSGPPTTTGTGNPSSVVIIEDTPARYNQTTCERDDSGHLIQGLNFLTASSTSTFETTITANDLGPQATCEMWLLWRRTVKEPENTVDVEMGRQQIGGQVELGIAACGDVDVGGHEAAAAGRAGDPVEPRAPELVVVEQAVPMSTEDRAAHHALRMWIRSGREPALFGAAVDPPVMDLVAGERLLPATQGLVGMKGDVDVQQSETGNACGPGFHRIV